MSKVYFVPIKDYSNTKKISASAKLLVDKICKEEKIVFEKEVPLKVHFGEKGNETFIREENFHGIIDYLIEKNCSPFFTDTNVLYRGERTTRDKHIALAKKHGFNKIPIKIADGEMGEETIEIKIDGKHFESCSIGKLFGDYNQMIVLAHFKGHIMAGFGGAIKQLSMGCASRGGKLAMHAHAKPFINPLACKKCFTCVKHCPADACKIGKLPHIDKNKCIGCAMCIAVCPYGAVKINWVSTGQKEFDEKLAEYALAATKTSAGANKEIVYVNFVFNITKNCDCEGKKMKPIAENIGLLASTDPVALDKACFDLIHKNEGKKLFSGEHTIDYAKSIGLGTNTYELVKL